MGKHDNDSDDEDEGKRIYDEEDAEYRLEQAHGYVKKGEKPKGKCLGLIVDGGYMFLLDKDMSSFPLVTWHCPKYKEQGCPASFVTRITNTESVRDSLVSPTNLAIAQSLDASHVMENQDKIENHANHRPGHYKENISPLIHGLFSREVREAFVKYLRERLASCRNQTPRPSSGEQ